MTIAGIGIGLLTIFIGSWVLAFVAIGGGVEWEPFYWLVLAWMLAPVVSGVAALLSLRVATGIAAIPVALGLILTGLLLWSGHVFDAMFLGGLAIVLPAVMLVVCLSLRSPRTRKDGTVVSVPGE